MANALQRPNVLLITSDQQHFSTLGCVNPAIHTPNLDRLAARGTMFRRAYCPNPTCTPTRASIITGQYPSQHGAWSLGTKLPETAHTVGEDFAAGGYDTTLIGKAHFQPLASTPEYPSLEAYPTLQDLAFWRTYKGPFYGFRNFELARNHTDEAHVGQHYALWLEAKGCKDWRKYFSPPTGTTKPQLHCWNIPEELHYNAWIAERTNAHLSRCRESGTPFFLWASFFDPHPSYLVPEPWDRMYDPQAVAVPTVTPGEHGRNPPHFGMTQQEKPDFSVYREPGGSACHGMHSHLREHDALAKDIAVYYGMVSMMDKYIGRVLDHLETSGMADDTLIVFTSDHGHFFGQHGLTTKGPFHYEDVIKVPMLVSWPGHVPTGVQSDALQSLVDLPVSFLSAAGLNVPRIMTGLDQSMVWQGRAAQARDHIIVENHHQPTRVHLKTLVDSRYKITVYRNQTYGEIFDLASDPGEVQNLWDSPAHAELKSRLLLQFMSAEMEKEPVWMPRISGA